MRLGIVSFSKSEGRLKTPEYVAAVTQVYRRAIDQAWESQKPPPVSSEDRYQLEMAFSRAIPLFRLDAWRESPEARSCALRQKTGRVYRSRRNLVVGRHYIEVKVESPVRPGDGVVDRCVEKIPIANRAVAFIRQHPRQNGTVRLGFEYDKIDFAAVKVGNRIWKTD